MEGMRNRAEAYGCIEIAKGYIKKKKLHSALRLSIRAYKLFPTPASKLFMRTLKSRVEQSNSKHLYSNQSISNEIITVDSSSESSSESENSDTSTNYDSNYDPQSPEQPKKINNTTDLRLIRLSEQTNKQEALKYLRNAEQCIAMNQIDLAEQFVLKSQKLHPTSAIDDFFQLLGEIRENNKQKYTEEQANIVEKVANSENYYSMFDLNHTATVSEIKEAYDNLALLLDPEKNQAPGAGEAFEVISIAVDTLCDNEKRLTYDLSLNISSSSPYNHTLDDNKIEDSNQHCQSPELDDNSFWSTLDFLYDSENENENENENEEYDSESEKDD